MANSISVISLNVFWSPLSLWTIAMPSIKQADRGRRLSTAGASFCNSLDNEDLAVFFREPSGAARDQGNGPRRWESTSLPWLCNSNHLSEQCTVGLKNNLFSSPFSELHFLVYVFVGLQHRLGHRLMKSYFWGISLQPLLAKTLECSFTQMFGL